MSDKFALRKVAFLNIISFNFKCRALKTGKVPALNESIDLSQSLGRSDARYLSPVKHDAYTTLAYQKLTFLPLILEPS
jgi:hypothetical protein